MLTPTDFIWNAVLPMVIASVAMFGGALARRRWPTDESPWRWLLPLGIALAVPAAMAACFPSVLGQFRESRHFLWLALVAPAALAAVFDLICCSIWRSQPLMIARATPSPAGSGNYGFEPVQASVPRGAPIAVVLVTSFFVIASGVALMLFRKTQIPGATSWSISTYAMHVTWVSLAGTALSTMLAIVARRERTLAVPIVLAITSLYASAWLLFGAASLDPARMAGMFGWAVFGLVAASIVKRSSAASSLLIAAIVAGWCVIAAFGTVFTLKPHPTAPFILAGPILMLAALVPPVARMKTLPRTIVVTVLGLLVGAAALAVTVKRYADEQNATREPAKNAGTSSDPYGGYR